MEGYEFHSQGEQPAYPQGTPGMTTLPLPAEPLG